MKDLNYLIELQNSCVLYKNGKPIVTGINMISQHLKKELQYDYEVYVNDDIIIINDERYYVEVPDMGGTINSFFDDYRPSYFVHNGTYNSILEVGEVESLDDLEALLALKKYQADSLKEDFDYDAIKEHYVDTLGKSAFVYAAFLTIKGVEYIISICEMTIDRNKVILSYYTMPDEEYRDLEPELCSLLLKSKKSILEKITA